MAITTKSATKITTKEVILNYPNLFKKSAMAEGEEGKYSCQIMFKKTDTELVNQVNAAMEAAKKSGAALWGGSVPEDLKTPLRDGDLEQLGEEYKGYYFMNLASKVKPMVVDRKLKEIKDPDEIYAGCFGRVSFNIFPYKHENGAEGNKEARNRIGIGCGLFSVQKLADGEPLGRTRPEDEFEAVEDEEDILS